MDEAELNKLLCSIFEEQSDKDEMYASELKGVLLRLRPDFNEKAYGCATFGKLLSNLAAKFGSLRIKNDNFNMMVSLNAPEQEAMPSSPGTTGGRPLPPSSRPIRMAGLTGSIPPFSRRISLPPTPTSTSGALASSAFPTL